MDFSGSGDSLRWRMAKARFVIAPTRPDDLTANQELVIPAPEKVTKDEPSMANSLYQSERFN
jgi:hypothetical protein